MFHDKFIYKQNFNFIFINCVKHFYLDLRALSSFALARAARTVTRAYHESLSLSLYIYIHMYIYVYIQRGSLVQQHVSLLSLLFSCLVSLWPAPGLAATTRQDSRASLHVAFDAQDVHTYMCICLCIYIYIYIYINM